ncbi:MAG: nucleotide exchange factor GrpE [Nanoarchaeota archaeon]
MVKKDKNNTQERNGDEIDIINDIKNKVRDDEKINDNNQNEKNLTNQNVDSSINKDSNFDEKNLKQKDKSKKSIFNLKNSKDEKIKELEQKCEELKNDYIRAVADFDNFRKRKEKELIEARERAVVDFVLSILPSIDNFEMSLKMTDNKEMFIKGVEMIHQNLLSTLKDNHFQEFVPAVDEVFDPYSHEPVLIEDNSKDSGKIIEVLQKGYKYKDKVVRPARVKVIKNSTDCETNNN